MNKEHKGYGLLIGAGTYQDQEQSSLPVNTTIRQNLLQRIVHVLDGFEIVQEVDTNEFTGTQTCIFYDGRVFSEMDGEDPKSNERIKTFAEMNSVEVGKLLLPWDTVGRTRIKAQPQVAKKHLQDGGN